MADTASTTIQFTTIEELFKWTNYVSLEISSPSKVHADKLYYQKHIPTIHPKVFSPKDFAEIEKERGLRRRKFRFRRYEAKSKILIIAIPTAAHEQLHHYLNDETRDEIVRMVLHDDWKSAGSTTFRPRGHPGGEGGEGDSPGCPDSQCSGEKDWPTLVIEAECSRSLDSLRRDMEWWFSASDHQVKIVFLVELEESRGGIIPEKFWHHHDQEQ